MSDAQQLIKDLIPENELSEEAINELKIKEIKLNK